jgi:hypothetical protein
MNAQIDRFPVSDLPDRYDIKRTALYERFKALDLKPIKQGNKSYVDGEQLQQLDDLHAHIQRGGGIADFLQESSPVSDSHNKISEQLAPINQSGVFLAFAEALTSRLVPAIVSKLTPPPPPLAHLEALERAYEKDWLLSTSELAQLLKLSPRTIRGYGDRFSEAGFIFTKAGTRARQETAWRVSKTRQRPKQQ